MFFQVSVQTVQLICSWAEAFPHAVIGVRQWRASPPPFLQIGVSGREDDHLLPQLPSDWATALPYGTDPLSIVSLRLCVLVCVCVYVCEVAEVSSVSVCAQLPLYSSCSLHACVFVSSSRRAKYCVKLSCGSPVENAPWPSRTSLGAVLADSALPGGLARGQIYRLQAKPFLWRIKRSDFLSRHVSTITQTQTKAKSLTCLAGKYAQLWIWSYKMKEPVFIPAKGNCF